MTWNVIEYALEPFGISEAKNTNFIRGNSILLLNQDAEDIPGTIYIADGTYDLPLFHHALIISCTNIPADNYIRLEQGSFTAIFNAVASVKTRLDRLNSTLAASDTNQQIIDEASIQLALPMFYLDESYRILGITKSIPFEGDAEWVHMSKSGYLSPESARRMKEAGDLDFLAAAPEPTLYQSDIYPFPCISCNVLLNGNYISRLNVLCVKDKPNPILFRACEIITRHLGRIMQRSGRVFLGSPLQSMLMDLLFDVRLSEDLIAYRLESAEYLKNKLYQVCYVDVDPHADRQIAPYYATLLKKMYPAAKMIPIVFQAQLVLLLYSDTAAGFDSLLVSLAHFFSMHHLRCGVSNQFRKMSALYGHYQQAVAAIRQFDGDGMIPYQSIMLEHTLSYIPEDQTEFLICPDIRRLQEAETEFSFSLLETLKVYLKCNCNLVRAAERLYIHKNTMLYRLNHIKEIMKCDLNNPDDRLLLLISIKLLERQEEK